ncbi:PAS domain-containing protein [Salisaeta longa]|uniref:PAS domain-containing protein n=1 Tax=Salisaeta longa TaxID=503170 RepID=UPI001E431EBF|nr:PAS domain-containing protein [Salisaeta longa]
MPQLHLDRSGTILHATPTAQRLLEYDDEEALNPCFFTHVHGRNLHQVMQDMAHMVRQRKRKASWFLRLRTGNGRWRWFRAQASNKLYAQPPHIAVNLQPV